MYVHWCGIVLWLCQAGNITILAITEFELVSMHIVHAFVSV